MRWPFIHCATFWKFKTLQLPYMFSPWKQAKLFWEDVGPQFILPNFFLLNHFFVHWEHDHGKWDQVALKKHPENHLLARMVSLDEHLKKNHPKKPYNEKDGFSKTKIEPRIYHLNNTHHTLLFLKSWEFLIIDTFVIFKLYLKKIQGNIF